MFSYEPTSVLGSHKPSSYEKNAKLSQPKHMGPKRIFIKREHDQGDKGPMPCILLLVNVH